MSAHCCNGFLWKGDPKGAEIRMQDHDVYVVGENKQSAVLLIHDGFGWKLRNQRILADHFAQEIGATVFMPDFFHGTAVDASHVRGPEEEQRFLQNYDWKSWRAINAAEIRMPAILSFVRHLRQTSFERIAAVGYCWGGRPALLLGAKEQNGLIDCISIAHPSFTVEDDYKNVGVPLQILAPEHDPSFTPELKKYANEVVPTLGVEYDYMYFPKRRHGFATKCDESDREEKRALELAKGAVVFWVGSHFGE